MVVGLKMLALKEITNTSQPIFVGKHDLEITNSNVSRNVSLHLERIVQGSKNVRHEIGSSSTPQQNDWELSTKGSQNTSHEIGNSTSQHTNSEFSTKGSQNVNLQVENSTSHHTAAPTTIPTRSSNDQHAETLSKNSLTTCTRISI